MNTIQTAQQRFAKVLAPDEIVEWSGSFQMKTARQRIRTSILAVVFAAVFVSVVTFVPNFYQLVADNSSQLVFVGVLCTGLFLYAQLIEPQYLIALTNKRIVMTPAKEAKSDKSGSQFVWTLYAEDIAKIHRVTEAGDRTIRLVLNPNRPQLNHIKELNLNGLEPNQADEGWNLLERYKNSVVTPKTERLDEEDRHSLKAMGEVIGQLMASHHSAKELILIAVLFVGLFGFIFKTYTDNKTWPSTPAAVSYSKPTVKRDFSRVMKGDFAEKYLLDMTLTYSVKGKQYKDVTKEALCLNNMDEVNAQSKPATKNIIFNPENPAECVYDRKESLVKSFALLFFAGALGISAGLLKILRPDNLLKKIAYFWGISTVCVVTAYALFDAFSPLIANSVS